MRTNGTIQLFPLLRIALCLVAGVFVGCMAVEDVCVKTWGFLFCALLLPCFFLFRHPIWQGMVLMLAVVAGGAYLGSRESVTYQTSLNENPEVYEAVLTSRPVKRGKVMKCDLRITSGMYAGKKIKASILRDTVSMRCEQLRLGDGVVACSALQPLGYDVGMYDNSLYLKSQGYFAQTFIYVDAWCKSTVSLRSMSVVERARLRMMEWREHLLQRYHDFGFEEESLALVSAMTLGDKSALSREVREVFSISGASHVLALSGLHLGIIYAFLSLIIPRRRFRFASELFLVVMLWSYALLVGLSPSIVRAAMMLTLYSLTSLLRRDKFSLNTLGLAATVMLIWHPLMVFDIGFQLSFLAVLFILVLFKPLYALIRGTWFERFRPFRLLWSMTSVSIAAQLGVFPLILYYFGRISPYFLLSNFIVIPAAVLLLYCMIFVWLFVWLPAIQSTLVHVVSWVVECQLYALSEIALLPGADIGHVHINLMQTVLLYTITCAGIMLFYKFRPHLWKRKMK